MFFVSFLEFFGSFLEFFGSFLKFFGSFLEEIPSFPPLLLLLLFKIGRAVLFSATLLAATLLPVLFDDEAEKKENNMFLRKSVVIDVANRCVVGGMERLGLRALA